MGFEVGQRVADYEIVGLLGAGGMGRVYRVRNVISHRTEAMKVLLEDLSAEPDLASRFLSEIRTLACLDHPNIAQLHTALQVGNELIMMMEFIDGSTLQQLARETPLPLEKIVNYIHQVLAALSFAHSRGVIHRDIKPANIMVTPRGIVKLTDFGIAKSKIKEELTRPGTTIGSLNYMSPEQAQGGCKIDARADIYSLGITMYELLTGRRPFEDESAWAILHGQLNIVPPPPIEVNPLLPRPLSDVIVKALEKDPARRFQSAAAFSEALRKATGIAASGPMHMRTGSGPSTAPTALLASAPVAHRRRWVAAGALPAAGLLALAGVGFPYFLDHGAMAKTVLHPLSQKISVPLAAHVGTGAVRTESPALAPAPKPEPPAAALSVALPAALPVASAPASHAAEEKPAAVPAVIPAVIQDRRSVKLKLARTEYQTASLPDVAPEGEVNAKHQPAATISAAELQQLGSIKAGLESRATALRVSVQRLKSQQEAAGGELSQDIAGAYVRMNAYLNAEKDDLEDGDAAAARDHLDRAAAEVSTLEKLFNR